MIWERKFKEMLHELQYQRAVIAASSPKVPAKVKISPEGRLVVKKIDGAIDRIEHIIEYIDFDGAPIVEYLDKALIKLREAKSLAK